MPIRPSPAPEAPPPIPTGATTASPNGAGQIGRGIAIAAGLIALGNILSSILGQVRSSTIAALFSDTVEASAYFVASAVPNTLYDLLVGGLVSAALVPVFSELAERDDGELGQVAGTIFTMILLAMAGAVSLVLLFAPALGNLLTDKQQTLTTPEQAALIQASITTLIRWMAPALLFMTLSGLLAGLSQARRRFLLPAFAMSLFNTGMIVSAQLFNRQLGVRSLALGMAIGAGAQMLLLVPTLRGVRLRPNLRLRQPAVQRILRLYAPVVVGISFSIVGTTVDRRLATGVGGGAAAIMGYATTLIQFGMGVITSAISLAALPTLARQGIDPDDLQAYRRTLAMSLKSVLLLILPAAVGLAVLARPIVMVLFERGSFDPAATNLTTLALLLYVPSMVAAAIDQPLIFAFYARKNTLLPNLVQGLAIATYLVVALALVRSLGMWGLILGNVAQWVMHACVMLVLAQRRLGALQDQRLGEAAGKGLLASLGMGFVVWALTRLAGGVPQTQGAALTQLVLGAFLGIAVYGVLGTLLRIEVLSLFTRGLRRRLIRT